MSDFAVSTFWQYVKPDEFRTCDLCGVTQPMSHLLRLTDRERLFDVCKDGVFCTKTQAAKGRVK